MNASACWYLLVHHNNSQQRSSSLLQLPTFNHDVFLCFGAVVPEGYGVCYCPQDHRTVFIVSSFRSCPETDSQVFGAKLMESMREMQAVLIKAKGLSAKIWAIVIFLCHLEMVTCFSIRKLMFIIIYCIHVRYCNMYVLKVNTGTWIDQSNFHLNGYLAIGGKLGRGNSLPGLGKFS